MLPFTYKCSKKVDNFDDYHGDVVQYEDAKFVRDFGIFKKGEVYDLVVVSCENFVMSVLKTQKFEIMPDMKGK